MTLNAVFFESTISMTSLLNFGAIDLTLSARESYNGQFSIMLATYSSPPKVIDFAITSVAPSAKCEARKRRITSGNCIISEENLNNTRKTTGKQ